MIPERLKKFINTPWWPVILSGFVIPGLGQIFNRDYFKGLFLMTASFLSLTWFTRLIVQQMSGLLSGGPEAWEKDPVALHGAVMKIAQENAGVILTFYALIFAIWIFGMIDAYSSAKIKLTGKPA